MCVSSRDGFSISAQRTLSSLDASSAGMDSGAAVRASSKAGISSGAMSAGWSRRFSKAAGDAGRPDSGRNFELRDFRAQCAAGDDRIQERIQRAAVTEHAATFYEWKFLVLHSQPAHDDHRETSEADRGRKKDFLGGAVLGFRRPSNHGKQRGKDFIWILHDPLSKFVPVRAT